MPVSDLRRLRYFLKIVEAGSLTRAAEALHVAQPALSHHLGALEREFGVQLIVRGSRGVQPTEAGARLAREATDVLEMMRLMPDRVRRDDTALEGVVAVALTQSIGSRVVAPLMALAATRLPGVRLEIREHMLTHLPSLVRSGGVDLGLSYNTRSGDGLLSRKLEVEDAGLLGARAEAVRRFGRPLPPQVPFRALAGLPLYLTLRSSQLREFVEAASQKTRTPLRVVAEIDSMHFLREVARSGAGFAILPRSNLDALAERERLWWAPIVAPRLAQDICLIVRSGRPLSRAAQAVCDLMSEVVTGAAAADPWPPAAPNPQDG